MYPKRISRRDFLKLTATSTTSMALLPWSQNLMFLDIVGDEHLGRVCVGSVELKIKPDPNSATVGVLYEDAVIPWLRETAGRNPYLIFSNQRWVETPEGYIYGPYLQPVFNKPNPTVKTFPTTSLGNGMWAEVTVPYVDAILDREPSSNSWVKFKLDDGLPLRFYYSQVFWVDQIKENEQGKILYRVNPNYYGGIDLLWADAEAFRPLTEDELTPIQPEAVNKRIVVDIDRQSLSCFEGESEVYFCRVSTGAKFDMYGNVVDEWETPVGQHKITRKYISLQMSGGTTGAGYDLPGIGWSTIFATGGVAIHSTFWHNNFGDPVSHGCVNCTPEDAKWIFRWSLPSIPYDPGALDVTVSGDVSTNISVQQG